MTLRRHHEVVQTSLRTGPEPLFNAVDLFAGAGGLSLGLSMAGIESTLAVEIDKNHAATYNGVHGLHTLLLERDIRDLVLEWTSLKRALRVKKGTFDFVVGGPPCQPFSMAGKRRGLHDPRGSLIEIFLDFVELTQPRAFIMENVAGLRSIHNGAYLKRVIDRARSIGYTNILGPIILNAAEYGVPQIRRRLFLIASREKRRKLDLPVRTHYDPQNTLPLEGSARPFVTVYEAISDLPSGRAQRTATTDDDELPYSRPADNEFQSEMRGLLELVSGNLETRHFPHIRSRLSRAALLPGDEDPSTRYRRLIPNRPAFTLRAGSGSFTALRPIHPALPRVITIREAARLQSFPDYIRFSAVKKFAYQQIGNAVPPFLARAVGLALLRSFSN